MDVSKYIPVGEENAVQVTLVMGTTSFTGIAWRAAQTSTEVTLRSITAIESRTWVVAASAITAMTVPPEQSS